MLIFNLNLIIFSHVSYIFWESEPYVSHKRRSYIKKVMYHRKPAAGLFKYV